MFLIEWVFDKLGYMPKVSIDAAWPFPANNLYKPHEFEKPVKKTAKKTVAKKTVAKKTVRKKD